MKEQIEVPRGNSKQERAIRRTIIKRCLEPLVGTTIICPCLGNVPIELTRRGLSETIHHASKGYHSTLSAINLKQHLRDSTFYRYRLPKDNRQSGKMGFAFIVELHDKKGTRTVKILIGVTVKPQYLHYCITSEE